MVARQSKPIDTSSPDDVVRPLWQGMHRSAVRKCAGPIRGAESLAVPYPVAAIATAAIAHLAQSTPPEFLFSTTDFNSYVTISTAEGAPQRVNGRMAASKAPGLGVHPRLDVLGKRVVVVE